MRTTSTTICRVFDVSSTVVNTYSRYAARVTGAALTLLWAGIPLVAQTAAPDSDLSARDMFYSAADMLGTQAKSVRKPAPKPVVNSSGTAAPAKSLKAVSESLGLRYSILKKSPGEEQYAEVAADTVFRAGDQIRLSVMSNEKGFLYIVQKGSSGNWSPLFPHPEINGGDNAVLPAKTYKIPEQGSFTMDATAGDERLFFLLTRKPEPDFQKLTMTLQQTDSPSSASAINDGVIDRIRGDLQARDLVFTKGDEKANDKGVYVVNPASSTNSQVIADVKLSHR